MHLSVVRPSVCPIWGRSLPLMLVCCWGLGGQKISIDCCTAGGGLAVSSSGASARRKAANAGSATSSVDVGS